MADVEGSIFLSLGLFGTEIPVFGLRCLSGNGMAACRMSEGGKESEEMKRGTEAMPVLSATSG